MDGTRTSFKPGQEGVVRSSAFWCPKGVIMSGRGVHTQMLPAPPPMTRCLSLVLEKRLAVLLLGCMVWGLKECSPPPQPGAESLLVPISIIQFHLVFKDTNQCPLTSPLSSPVLPGPTVHGLQGTPYRPFLCLGCLNRLSPALHLTRFPYLNSTACLSCTRSTHAQEDLRAGPACTPGVLSR